MIATRDELVERARERSGLSDLGVDGWQEGLDQLLVGTAAMIMLPHPESFFRCQVFPPGSYSIAQDATGKIDTFVRNVSMTVRQVVDEFGYELVSASTKKLFGSTPSSMTLSTTTVGLPSRRARPSDRPSSSAVPLTRAWKTSRA